MTTLDEVEEFVAGSPHTELTGKYVYAEYLVAYLFLEHDHHPWILGEAPFVASGPLEEFIREQAEDR